MQDRIAFNRVFKPLASVLGMGPGRSEVRVADGSLSLRMGWAFRATIPLADVDSAELVTNPRWWWSIGAHIIGTGRWILNGTLKNLVEIRFRRPVAASAMGMRITVNSVIVSVQDPSELIATLPGR